MSELLALLAGRPALARARKVKLVELYHKRGRTHRYERVRRGERYLENEERGFALRAGGEQGSWFFAATGAPRWPPSIELGGAPLQLPTPAPDSASAPEEHDAAPGALTSELGARRLIDTLAVALERDAPLCELEEAVLEDGASESALESSLGTRRVGHHRAATLRLVASAPGNGTRARKRVVATAFARHAGELDPAAAARRLLDLLAVAKAPPPSGALGAVACVLAPEAAAPLLALLAPLLVGRPSARDLVGPGAPRQLGGDAFTVIDDGRLPGGLLSADRDGEGVPTRAVTLIERGRFRQPLLAWNEATGGGEVCGCRPRHSWREPPQAGPSHFFLAPDPGTSPAELLLAMDRGLYLIDADPPRFELAGQRFVLPARGFLMAGGQAVAPVDGILLCGTLGELCRGVRAVARDLRFVVHRGAIGSPSVLLEGLLVSSEGPGRAHRG